MKILITGAAGVTGSTLVKGLKGKYQPCGLDLIPMLDLDDTITGDIADVDIDEPTPQLTKAQAKRLRQRARKTQEQETRSATRASRVKKGR